MNTHEERGPATEPALEEAYAALGQLLDAAALPLDEPALVERVARCIDGRRRSRSRRRRRLAAAATLLLATGAGAWRIGRTVVDRAPRAVAVRTMVPELAWDDGFETEVAWTRWAVMSVEGDAHRRPDAAVWVQQRLNELEWEVGADWSIVNRQ